MSRAAPVAIAAWTVHHGSRIRLALTEGADVDAGQLGKADARAEDVGLSQADDGTSRTQHFWRHVTAVACLVVDAETSLPLAMLVHTRTGNGAAGAPRYASRAGVS
jgi:hypothetical protein